MPKIALDKQRVQPVEERGGPSFNGCSVGVAFVSSSDPGVVLCAQVGEQARKKQARTVLAPEVFQERSGENAPILVLPLGFFSERIENGDTAPTFPCEGPRPTVETLGAQTKFLTNAMLSSSWRSPTVVRNAVDVNRNVARNLASMPTNCPSA